VLSVVIVNYRRWDWTARLVRQLVTTPCCRRGAAEVVVVDNHSPAHPIARRLRRWRGVSLRRWGRNRGFARAVNEGCRLSRGRWLLLLNPDVALPDGFLEGVLNLVETPAAANPRVGILGFQLRNDDGSRQGSCGFFPTLLRTLAGLALPRARRKYRPLRARERCRVDWVTGCCLLVRRECLEDLGGFDRSFFLYYEDVDFCQRAQARGWSVWHEPALRVVHHAPLHGRPVPPHLRVFTRHALLTYAVRHWPWWQFRFLVGVVQAEAWLRRLGAGRRGDRRAAGLFRHLQHLAGEMAAGRKRAVRRRLARCIEDWEAQGTAR
jgi:GT2 family glycosyltransferase